MPFAEKSKAAGALIALGMLPGSAFPQEMPNEDPKEIADWITGRRLAGLPDPEFNFWNFTLHAFDGPWKNMRFEQGLPELTLLDLYSACLTEVFPKRLLGVHPLFLQGALALPRAGEGIAPKDREFWFSHILTQESYPYSGYPFYVRWGQEGSSIALHPGSLKNVKGGHNKIEIEYGALPNLEERDGCKEVEFTFPDRPDIKILVNGVQATVFRPQDRIEVEGDEFKLQLRFLPQGRGAFIGHLSKGNRPSEWSDTGSNRFHAYHKLLSFRTIDREDEAKLLIEWEFQLK